MSEENNDVVTGASAVDASSGIAFEQGLKR